jgi:hypothetical protein
MIAKFSTHSQPLTDTAWYIRSGISDTLVLVGCVLVPGGRWVTWIVKRFLVLVGYTFEIVQVSHLQ